MYRTIDTATWKDPWFSELSRDARLVFLYLITNERSASRYELAWRFIPFETGLTDDEVRAALTELSAEVTWDQSTSTVEILHRMQWVGDGLRPPYAAWEKLRKATFERDSYTCQYCGAHGVALECDHVVPISRGGINELSNLTTACRDCNQSKSDKTLEEWLR